MKKTLFLIALLAMPAGYALGGPLSFGFRVGGDMATQVSSVFGYSSQQTGDVIFGLTGGIFVETDLADFLSLQPEVDYVRKGLVDNLNNIPVAGPSGPLGYSLNAQYTFTYDYLEVPVLLKAHTLLSAHLTGSLSAGPEVGFLLGSNEHYSVSSVIGDQPNAGQGVDWGVIVGGGLELDDFLIDLRYDRGMKSVSSYSNGPANSVLSLLVGYRIE